MPSKNGKRAREQVTLGIAVAVTVVWCVATLVQVASPARPVPGYANIIMASVVGSLFGTAYLQSRKREREMDGKEDEA